MNNRKSNEELVKDIESIVQSQVGQVNSLLAYVNLDTVLGVRKVQIVIQHERMCVAASTTKKLQAEQNKKEKAIFSSVEDMVRSTRETLEYKGYSVSDEEDVNIGNNGGFIVATFRTNLLPISPDQEKPVVPATDAGIAGQEIKMRPNLTGLTPLDPVTTNAELDPKSVTWATDFNER